MHTTTLPEKIILSAGFLPFLLLHYPRLRRPSALTFTSSWFLDRPSLANPLSFLWITLFVLVVLVVSRPLYLLLVSCLISNSSTHTVGRLGRNTHNFLDTTHWSSLRSSLNSLFTQNFKGILTVNFNLSADLEIATTGRQQPAPRRHTLFNPSAGFCERTTLERLSQLLLISIHTAPIRRTRTIL
jgi:hypothetical protein